MGKIEKAAALVEFDNEESRADVVGFVSDWAFAFEALTVRDLKAALMGIECFRRHTLYKGEEIANAKAAEIGVLFDRKTKRSYLVRP